MDLRDTLDAIYQDADELAKESVTITEIVERRIESVGEIAIDAYLHVVVAKAMVHSQNEWLCDMWKHVNKHRNDEVKVDE